MNEAWEGILDISGDPFKAEPLVRSVIEAASSSITGTGSVVVGKEKSRPLGCRRITTADRFAKASLKINIWVKQFCYDFSLHIK